MELLATSCAFEGGDSGATLPPLGRATPFSPTASSIPILLLLCTHPMRFFWLLPGRQPTDMQSCPCLPVAHKIYLRRPLLSLYPKKPRLHKTKWTRHETSTRFKISSAKNISYSHRRQTLHVTRTRVFYLHVPRYCVYTNFECSSSSIVLNTAAARILISRSRRTFFMIRVL